MGRNILHVIEAREQQGTEGPLAHDRTVTFQLCYVSQSPWGVQDLSR
jgi:hypothetical protein